ncbi:Uma2 family endonuclease, partial [bacterium]|nr:Uma2 family endonuclease [bacterium]
MGLAVRKEEERFTYGDYLKWQDDQRWELIDGVAYNMNPAPLRKHQGIAGELYRQISNYLIDKPCQVYVAPFDVRLP